MDDFAKFIAANKNSSTQEKQGKWLTKDRVWNFVFWFGMSLGLSISFAFNFNASRYNRFSYWSVFFFWFTIIVIPLILKIFNGTKFIKALTFANSEGHILTEEQRPYLFGYAIFAGLPTVFAIAETVLKKAPENFIIGFILFLSFFAPISLYFIYKNCPISILFNRKFWTVDGNPNIALLKKVAKIINED
jgi:hypothetical protein